MSVLTTNKPAANKIKTNGRATNGKAKTNGHTKSDYLDPKLLLTVLTAVKKGDFSSRMPNDQIGVTGKIYDAFNEIIEKTNCSPRNWVALAKSSVRKEKSLNGRR